MDELDYGGEFDMVIAPVTRGSRGKEHQRGAQALAAGGDNVFGNLTNEHDV